VVLVVLLKLGQCLSLGDFERSVYGSEDLEISQDIFETLERSRSVYLKEIAYRDVYGACTGLGARLGYRGSCSSDWEARVIEEHAVGSEPWAPQDLVRGFMITRISQLSRGFAPVRGIILRRLVDAYNAGILPLIPLRGSLGASGDLVQSAHLARCLYMGLGDALIRSTGSIISCNEALKRISALPLELEVGESLAIINNTAWSTWLLGASVIALKKEISRSLEIFRRALPICRCNKEHYMEETVGLKKHRGLAKVATELRDACRGGGARLQDPYSLRCSPQIYASLLDMLDFAESIFVREACSPTENPIVVGDRVFHTCGFYASHVAIALDALSIAVAHLANLIERRMAQILRSEITGLPDFLAGKDSPVGSMIIHYIASTITSRIRLLASPTSIHTTPTSHLQEDITPQAGEAGIKLLEQIKLLEELSNLEQILVERAEKIAMRAGEKDTLI
jgi:histidine ammonia-lyase